ncbi:MAG: HAD-IC family P-type ATPase [Oscillospiraceae bacterium]|nr:HAD-IC family P-type ATPase [Oscillospiraceae bacterium]
MGKHEAPKKQISFLKPGREEEEAQPKTGRREAPAPEATAVPEATAAAPEATAAVPEATAAPEAKASEPAKKPSISFRLPERAQVREAVEKAARIGVSEGSEHAFLRTYPFEGRQIAVVAGGAALYFILWLLPTSGALRYLLYLLPLSLLGAWPLLDVAGELLERRFPGRSLICWLAAIGFLCLNQPHSAVFVLLIYRVLLLLESFLQLRRSQTLEALKARLPGEAVVQTEEGDENRPLNQIEEGELLAVGPDEIIPLDGTVVEGISSVDALLLCGSGTVIDVAAGSRVLSGCRNLSNPITVRVTAREKDSFAQRCIRTTQEGSEALPERESRLQRILQWVPAALAGLGLLFALVYSLASGNWRDGVERGLLLLALGCCGDVLLVSAFAFFKGITHTARKGLFFKNADAVVNLALADRMIFSKTGTVTEGRYEVASVHPVHYSEKDLLTIAALAECSSKHPIARALRKACALEYRERRDITLLEETAGRGVHTLLNGRNVYVGNSSLLLDHNVLFDVPTYKGTVVHVAVDNEYEGCIVLNDRVRDGAFDAIEELRQHGIGETVMLTGDTRSMARPVASALNFDMLKCELDAEAKLSALEYLQGNRGSTACIAYVSSKSGDLPLLEKADVGVAFNTMNADGPMDAASLQIPGSSISLLPIALHMARKCSLAALIDAAVWLGLLLVLTVLSLVGWMDLWLALLLVLLVRAGTLIYTALSV